MEDNQKFINTMRHLRDNNIIIYVQGTQYVFCTDFYDKIISDLKKIQNNLEVIVLPLYDNTNKFDSFTQEVKENFKFICFFKGNNEQFKMSHIITKYKLYSL
jgi:hypothetical protein